MTVVELYEITRDLSNPFYIFNHRNYKVVCNGEIVTGIQIDDKKGQVILKTYKKENEASEKETKMSFQMKNRYETGEEFYQDIKKHLIEDGFVTIKTDNETLVILSEEDDEWYCHYQTCSICNTDFMCTKPKFCPGCGRKIVGSKRGNETVFYGKGDE